MIRPATKVTLAYLLSVSTLTAQEPIAPGGGNEAAPSAPAPDAGSAEASAALADNADWLAAQAAHRDGLAEVAVLRLSNLANHEDLSPADRAAVNRLLGENLIRSGRHEEALGILPQEGEPFWRAVALAGLGRLAEAAPLLAAAAQDPEHPNREQALLSLASSQAALGNVDRAIETLRASLDATAPPKPRLRLALAELLLERPDPNAALDALPETGGASPGLVGATLMLRGQALLDKGAPESAEAPLRKVISSPPGSIPPAVSARATLLLADALLATGDKTEAVSLLKGFIETAPTTINVLPAFDRLSSAGAFTSNGDALLTALSQSPSENVVRAAAYFRCQIDSRGRERAAALERLGALASVADPVGTRAKLLLAECFIEDSDKERALAAIATLKESTDDPAVAARVAFVEAKALHASADFKNAADRFASVADSDTIAGQASFNAALASLRAGDEAAFRARSALLPEISGDFSRGSLQLERALYKASLQSEDASAALEEFLADHGNHPRAAEAYLALGSIHILVFPPKVKSARASLEAARKLELAPNTREQADYLAFWIEESAGESEKAAELADAFVKAWPNSSLAPGVRMRQAEIHFRNGDYLDALLNFEKLFADYPDSDLAEKAMFFGGRAAMLTLTDEGSKRALALWGKLAQRGGPLAALARRHQAQTKLRQGDQESAIVLLDAILESEPPPHLKISTLLLKGEALFVMGASDPSNIEAAIQMFAACLAEPEIRTAARNEALFRKGKAHEALGDIPAALDAFHQVITSPRRFLRPGESPEFVWFYRAGFEAIRILDSRQRQDDIRAAIAIADTLAAAPGPRAAEARKTAERLRLENFVWLE